MQAVFSFCYIVKFKIFYVFNLQTSNTSIEFHIQEDYNVVII